MNTTITQVPGLRVGHALVQGGGSGCTVILGPFRAAVDVRGMASGTRELTVLDPEHLVETVHALLFTGGSAFGLAAADGVVSWLEERGEGLQTIAGPVPIVPAAVIYDLAEGVARPGPGEGLAACEAATTEPVEQGRVGAGAGATVGKVSGGEWASPGGLGSTALQVGGYTVGALAVVNAVGDVLERGGGIVAGTRDPQGGFVSSADVLLRRTLPVDEADGSGVGGPAQNTTLTVVATDAPLGSTDLTRLARMAATAVAARISPVHTPFDGDLTFAISSAPVVEPVGPQDLLALGAGARRALEDAIVNAVRPADR